MRLHVGLIHDINTVAVTERIPERIVRIMAGSDRIDIKLFHDLDITDHILLRNHISIIRIHLMSVDTLDEHRLAVHLEIGTLNADIAETDLKTCLLSLSLLVVSSEFEII